MSYSLKDDGDAIERRWGEEIGKAFKNYEPFWIQHVVPITWRVKERRRLNVRSGGPKKLRELATCSYGIFIHLAGCHEQLAIAKADGDDVNAELFARTGVYSFYSRLYSAGALVPRFLEAVNAVVVQYHGTNLGGLKKRLGNLHGTYDSAFKERTKDYRNPNIHHWGLPAIGRRIPKRDSLNRWADRDLGELDRFLTQEDVGKQIEAQFIDAIAQAEADLAFAEDVINRIWKIALDELATISKKDRYKRDQAKGLDREIPRAAAEIVSSLTQATSGAVVASKS